MQVTSKRSLILKWHTIRRSVFSLLIVILCFVWTGTTKYQNQRVVRVGVYENKPKIFTDSKGVVSGFWPEIIHYIAGKENWQIEWVQGTWAENYERLINNEIDILPDTGWTEARSQEIDFSSNTLLVSWSRVYVPKGSSIETILDLDGKRVGGLTGSMNFDGTEGIKSLAGKFNVQCEFVEFTDYVDVFVALESGLIDAGVTNKDFGDLNEKNYSIKKTPIIFQPTSLRFSFTKDAENTPYLVERIDSNLDNLKADSKSIYYQALDRYIGQDLQRNIIKIIPPWVYTIFFSASGVILLLLTVSFMTRHQVQKQTAKLRVSEQRYQTLTRVVPVGIFSTNRLGETVYVNPAWCHISGISAEESMGIGWLNAVHPDDRERIESNWEITMQQQGISNADYRFVHPDGGVSWVIGQAVPELNTDGEVVGYIGTITDITERKKMEELQEALVKAESSDRMKSAFLATMSHELRTPLNSIIGFTGIILQKMVGPLNGEQEKQLTMVMGSARHLLALINDVLDISKVEAGQIVIVKDKFNFEMSVQRSVEKVRTFVDDKGLKLNVSLTPLFIEINSDQRRVEQILINLLNNAIKFTEHGEISLESHIEHNSLITSISDTGIGIKPEDLSVLFKPFQQLETGINRRFDGTGLGLSICKRLVELLDGEIWVASEWGKGSTFTFTLPLESEKKDES
ncbi:MAG: ATP-binding protein [Flexilinea sp.]